MADTFTTTLNLTKPEVGASADTWGTKLNDNLDDIDALFSAGPVLKVANGGTAATTASGARTSLGLGTMATQDASAVAITGGAAILGSFTLSSGNPTLVMTESGADADETNWRVSSDAGQFYIATINDAVTVQNSAVTIDRSGATVTSIALTATAVTINGNAAFHAGTFTAPSSGSFTISLRAVSEAGTVIGTGTAYWRKFNGVVTLRLPPIFPSSAATAFYLTGLPADIQVGAIGVGATQYIPISVVNGGVVSAGLASIYEGHSYMNIVVAGAAWSATDSAKGVAHTCMTYQIAN
jgi:hypothetical protein